MSWTSCSAALTGEGQTSTIAVAVAVAVAVAALFAVSGLVTIIGQLRITAWCKRRWRPGRSMAIGLAVMGAAFLPPLAVARHDIAPGDTRPPILQLPLLVLSAGLLALGTAIVFPFEMDTVVALTQDKLVARHYGFYNTVCGVGILLGNLGTGSALGAGRSSGLPELPWIMLGLIGLLCAAGIRALDTRELLPTSQDTHVPRRGRHRLRRGSTHRVDQLAGIAGSSDGGRPGMTAPRVQAQAEPGTVSPPRSNAPYLDGRHAQRKIGSLTEPTPSDADRPPPLTRPSTEPRSGPRRFIATPARAHDR